MNKVEDEALCVKLSEIINGCMSSLKKKKPAGPQYYWYCRLCWQEGSVPIHSWTDHQDLEEAAKLQHASIHAGIVGGAGCAGELHEKGDPRKRNIRPKPDVGPELPDVGYIEIR